MDPLRIAYVTGKVNPQWFHNIGQYFPLNLFPSQLEGVAYRGQHEFIQKKGLTHKS